MLAGYLSPYAINGLVHPLGELPVLLFIESTEKAQGFDGIERRFAVVIGRVELLHEVLNENLISAWITFMEQILSSISDLGEREAQPA